MVAITYKDGTPNTFHYDARGRRYAVEESAGLRYFTWDGNGMNLLCERDESGDVTAEYTHGWTPVDGIGSMVAAVKTDGGGTYYQYPIYDHRGTVVRLVDEAGAVTAYYEYDAWGNALHEEESGATNRFRYQSNWLALEDSDSALYLSAARLYDAETGKFLVVDPIRKCLHPSAYAYAANMPTRRVDPKGHQAVPDYPNPDWMASSVGSAVLEEAWGGPLPEGMDLIDIFYALPEDAQGFVFDMFLFDLAKPVPPCDWTPPVEVGEEQGQEEALIFLEQICTSGQGLDLPEGRVEIPWLASSLAKQSGAIAEQCQRLIDLAKDLGLHDAYIKKGANGTKYLIIKGYPGLRTSLKGTRYLASNTKVGQIVAAKKVSGGLTKRAFGCAIVTTVAFSVVEGILDRQTLGEIGVGAGVDVAVAGLGVLTSAAVGAGVGTFACPVVGTAVGMIVGVFVTTFSDYAIHHFEIKQKIYAFLVEVNAGFERHRTLVPVGGLIWIDITPDIGAEPVRDII